MQETELEAYNKRSQELKRKNHISKGVSNTASFSSQKVWEKSSAEEHNQASTSEQEQLISHNTKNVSGGEENQMFVRFSPEKGVSQLVAENVSPTQEKEGWFCSTLNV
jgi:hypothetical protein